MIWRRRRELPQDPGELALLADLVAAALDAGSPLTSALVAADGAVPGPRRHLLGPTARRLQAGDPDPVDSAEPALPAVLLRMLRRSGHSGARLAMQLRVLADDLRAEAAAEARERARRVGVLAVLPLGLCCLPAFMLLAVVPLAVGLLRDVLV